MRLSSLSKGVGSLYQFRQIRGRSSKTYPFVKGSAHIGGMGLIVQEPPALETKKVTDETIQGVNDTLNVVGEFLGVNTSAIDGAAKVMPEVIDLDDRPQMVRSRVSRTQPILEAPLP